MKKFILFKILIPLAILAVVLLIVQLLDQKLTVFDDLGHILSGIFQFAVNYVKTHVFIH